MSEDFLFMYNAGENKMYQVNEVICIYWRDMFFLGFDPCIYVTVLYVRTIDARKEKEKKNCCMLWNFLIEFLTFHW